MLGCVTTLSQLSFIRYNMVLARSSLVFLVGKTSTVRRCASLLIIIIIIITPGQCLWRCHRRQSHYESSSGSFGVQTLSQVATNPQIKPTDLRPVHTSNNVEATLLNAAS